MNSNIKEYKDTYVTTILFLNQKGIQKELMPNVLKFLYPNNIADAINRSVPGKRLRLEINDRHSKRPKNSLN